MTLLHEINEGNYKQILEKCAEILSSGGIVGFPTESSYGLGADATNASAVRKVHSVKGQGEDKPISIIVDSLEMAEKYCELNSDARKIVEELMPGAITLVVPKKEKLPDVLSKGSVGFRIPLSRVAQDLCSVFGGAVTATSANISGREALYSGKEVFGVFKGKIDAVIDAGELPKVSASTFFDVVNREVLREGPVSDAQIFEVLEEEE